MAAATTPRLLSTPRQLMTAVLNVPTSFGVSDSARENHRRVDVTAKSADAEAPFLELHSDIDVALWQGACWALLQSDSVSRTRTVVPLLDRLLDVRSMTPLAPRPLVSASEVRRLVDPVAAKATFMYNPFEAKTTASATTESYVYALGDLVGIDVEAANPLDIALVLPQLQAYCSGHMLAYPAAASLTARQERVSVLLTLRPQAVGDLVLEGIDCVLPQQTLQYRLPRPVGLQVVDAIALADWKGADGPVTLFANEDRVLPISLRNASTAQSMDDVTLLLSVHRQTDGFHAPATTIRALGAPGRVAISDFTIAWDAVALNSDRRLPPQETLLLPLRIESTRPDVVDVKLRALYRGRDPAWYRESTSVLRVHVRAGVSVLGAPSPGGVAVWNAADVPFRINGAVIAPQSVTNVALPSPACQHLPWETTEGSASGTLLVPERPPVPEAPASIALTTDTGGAWKIGAFYEVRVATSVESSVNPELVVTITVADAMTNQPVSAATCLLAGALEYTVLDPIHVHVLQVAFLHTGQFRVSATGPIGPIDSMCASMTVHVAAADAIDNFNTVE
ncbi:hypothetical protein SPRG_17233 [Saprolegnia parasitica CBS 223.65]|uniref:Uncharacterized protein n=1 Tax=Saprolegnia parasitica (strain CBS 223.65) TaxID=695850 RepID=A0A067BGS0_SAPPC|nr:hypothetical protein SPRG_17233 [Saprolegnia parasitica CBS 223.65]KDO17343.1 hypothetical protein SPRG_17233 [Saprolegnia parasitica CBS 223.65]|eukprot:XP_012211953.1 hypothetical protein SPRG_17233 [Saprolegnia parasitica CBS 223.65]